MCVFSRLVVVLLFITLWTVAHQVLLPMEFFQQEYWSMLSFPSSGDLPDSGIELASPVSAALQVDSLPTEPSGKPLKKMTMVIFVGNALEEGT